MTDKVSTAPDGVERLAKALGNGLCESGCGTMTMCVCSAAGEAQDTLRALSAEVERLKVALRACIDMIDDSMKDAVNHEGIYVKGVSDLELRPDGSYMLSQARAALGE